MCIINPTYYFYVFNVGAVFYIKITLILTFKVWNEVKKYY